MCTGSANVCWRQVLHPPQLRRLFAPGSHLTGEQLLALVLALFIRHRLTAGHPDLTATGALDFTAGGASGTNSTRAARHTRAPTWIPSARSGSLATSSLCAIPGLEELWSSESNPAIERLYGLRRSALVSVGLLSASM